MGKSLSSSYIFNRLLIELSARSGMNLSRPNYICAKMTMRCNSRCVHCDIWKMQPEEELSTAQWRTILDNLHAWLGSFRMVFTGGEALLRDDMIDLLRHAAHLGIVAELLSNGIIIDDLLAERIISSGVAQITISFDGMDAETHDRFRGEGFHARTLSAIAALAAHRRTRRAPVRILLKTVISSNNLDQLCAIAAFCKAHGLEVQYQPIEQNYGQKTDPLWYRTSDLWIDDTPLLKMEIARLKQLKAARYPIVNSARSLDTITNYFEQPGSVQMHGNTTDRRHCKCAVWNFVISANGDVRMCYKMEPIGNVAIRSPQEIWAQRYKCWKKHSCLLEN